MLMLECDAPECSNAVSVNNIEGFFIKAVYYQDSAGITTARNVFACSTEHIAAAVNDALDREVI